MIKIHMKKHIYYLFCICLLIPACNKKPTYQIPKYTEETDSVVSNPSIIIDEDKKTAPQEKSNVFLKKKELANDYGWIVYIDGTFNPYDSCFSDFKLYIENQKTQEQRIIAESQEGKSAKLPVKGEDRSYRTIEKIKEVHLLSSKRMLLLEENGALIVDIESLSFIKVIHIPFFCEFTGIVDEEWNGLERTLVMEFKAVDDVTFDTPRIFTRRYNSEGEMIYEDETIIKYDNPNPVIPKETGTLCNKIREHTSNLPINAEEIADGYGWIVYKQETSNIDDAYCDTVKLYIENIKSHKLYYLLKLSCGNQSDLFSDQFEDVDYFESVEVLSPSKLLITMTDVRNLYSFVLDLETFSAIFIDYGIEVSHKNGQTYLIHMSCNEKFGKYQFWESRYDIYGNLLHDEVKTILYPPDYQIEGDCF